MALRKNKPKRVVLELSVANKEPKNVEELILFGKTYPGLPGLYKVLPSLCPDAVRVVLNYGFSVSVTGTAGEVDSYLFTGNGVFDPDVTGTGAQPMGLDLWHGFYGRNRVVASSIHAQLSAPAAATNGAVDLVFGVVPSNSTAIPTGTASFRSMPYAKLKFINAVSPLGMSLQSSMETYKMLGIPKLAPLIDDNLAGTSAANPSELWYWILIMQPVDQATAVGYKIEGCVSYLVDFMDRNVTALSAALESDLHRTYILNKRKQRSSSKK
jgi:hypothetical protein